MDLTKLSELKILIDECKSDPSLLFTPSLSFFREYLQSLGAKLPNAAYEEDKAKRDMSDENREAAQELKGKAMDSVSEGKFYKAIQHLTRAISLNPTSAILYGNRACVYIKLRNPKAAFRDAVTALEINPDSAKGYKARGMARALLGEWVEAEKDLHLASMIDYDAEISDVLKEIDPHINKIDERWRQGRHADAQSSSSARQKAKKKGHLSSKKDRQEPSRQARGGFPGSFHDSFPGIFPGGFLGGFPGSFPPGDFLCDHSGFLRGSPFDSPFGYQN